MSMNINVENIIKGNVDLINQGKFKEIYKHIKEQFSIATQEEFTSTMLDCGINPLGVDMDAVIDRMFEGNKNLVDFIIPDNGEMKIIYPLAFCDCTNLKSIKIPNTVVQILYGAFKNCSSLKEIKLPDNLEVLGANAFYGCTQLRSITLPASLFAIDRAVFANCPLLKEIKYEGTSNDWKENVNNSEIPGIRSRKVLCSDGVEVDLY